MDGLFRNFGFLLEEGGVNDETGLALVSFLDDLTVRSRGPDNPDEVLYWSARRRRRSRGCLALSVEFGGEGWKEIQGWGAGGVCGVSTGDEIGTRGA